MTAHTDYVEYSATSSGITGYTPAQIRTAYGFNSLSYGSTAANGAGQTIAIIDAYNDPNITSDLAAFDSAMGIAAPQLQGRQSKRWQHAARHRPESRLGRGNGAGRRMGTCHCPGGEHRAGRGEQRVGPESVCRRELGPPAVRRFGHLDELGSDDSLSNASSDQSLSSNYLVTPTGHQGITFVASAGDDGEPNFPAESPNVLAVGGTDLYLTSSGSITSETAWTPTTSDGQTWSGGGGVSQEFPGRDVPDVAYNAGVGMAVYDTFGPDHGWVSIGGTSTARRSGRHWLRLPIKAALRRATAP